MLQPQTGMSPVAHVTIHRSQFPDAVRRDLLASLRHRQVNHKFHYDSVKQAQQWLALHQAFSPSRNDADCAATYDRAFAGAVARIPGSCVHLIGLGCGGGQKDTRLLQSLHARGRQISYTPCDVSTAMVLVARQQSLEVINEENCFPLVCDLATADDLPEVLASHGPRGAIRLFTFFGMIPNFEPAVIFPRLASLVRPGDFLLVSANLAPGDDAAAGIRRVLPQYDNALTREWLMTFLLDLGMERGDGELCFHIEDGPAASGLKRITAVFHFKQSRAVSLDDERVTFSAGSDLRVFFSYRSTPARLRAALFGLGLEVLEEWNTLSQEEGIVLCKR